VTAMPDADAVTRAAADLLATLFNLLVARDIGLSVGDIAALGVRRISVGPALALAAWTGFMRVAQALKSDGSFAGLAGLASFADVNDFLAADLRMRG